MSRLTTKPTKWYVRPMETQISLGIRPVWSESSRSAWRKLGSLAVHWMHSKDSGQTGRMPRLIWAFAGRIVILLVLSWDGSYVCSLCTWWIFYEMKENLHIKNRNLLLWTVCPISLEITISCMFLSIFPTLWTFSLYYGLYKANKFK